MAPRPLPSHPLPAGIDITEEQIAQMEANVLNIDFAKAEKKETETRHDVMAHVYTFGDCCPAAQGIIHMGATSCFVGDNTDIIQLKEGMELLRRKLVKLLAQMKTFAGMYATPRDATPSCTFIYYYVREPVRPRSTHSPHNTNTTNPRPPLPVEQRAHATLGFTHYQAAQLTTVGKRMTLYMQDFLMDLDNLEREIETIPMRGLKGTTGTQVGACVRVWLCSWSEGALPKSVD